MSLRAALERVFLDQPGRVFGVQDLCQAARQYYEVTAFQEEPDRRWGQSLYAHEVRSTLGKLKRGSVVVSLGYNRWKLNPERVASD